VGGALLTLAVRLSLVLLVSCAGSSASVSPLPPVPPAAAESGQPDPASGAAEANRTRAMSDAEFLAMLPDFSPRLAALSLRLHGRFGLAVCDVETGLSAGINAQQEMPADATIMIPIMVEVFRELVAGNFDLNTHLRLRDADRDGASRLLARAPRDSSFTVSRLLASMIDVGDTTAANMLVRLVGGRKPINATMAELGLAHTRVGGPVRSVASSRETLRSSPADMARLLCALGREQLVDEWSSRAMIRILAATEDNGLLPAALPRNTAVAHRSAVARDAVNDAGLVYVGNAPYVIAIMTTDFRDAEEAKRFIREASRVAYDAFGYFRAWIALNGPPTVGLERPLLLEQIPDASTQMWRPIESRIIPPAAAPVSRP
jgi:beta-lactamase class A